MALTKMYHYLLAIIFIFTLIYHKIYIALLLYPYSVKLYKAISQISSLTKRITLISVLSGEIHGDTIIPLVSHHIPSGKYVGWFYLNGDIPYVYLLCGSTFCYNMCSELCGYKAITGRGYCVDGRWFTTNVEECFDIVQPPDDF
jgi:hypothetical protein